MAQPNEISVNINSNDLAAIKSATDILKTKLLPYLKKLSIDDRKELPKMGDKTVAFVQKAIEYCDENPELVPAFLDVDEFKIDWEAVKLLRELFLPLAQIVDALDDSITLSGSEAYQAALIFYNSAKYGKKTGVPNAGRVADDLANRFPRGKRNKTNT